MLPFQLVTMGQPIADFANELFASNAYRDYLEVHGIGVQLTEALAEYWHRRIREELKFSGDRAMAAEDPEAKEDYFKLGYRGARFAFGYGACPDLEDRAKMMALLERTHRCDVIRGITAASRTVDRRVRPAPSGSQVLQRLI